MCQVPFYDFYLLNELSNQNVKVKFFTREPTFIKNYFRNHNFKLFHLTKISQTIFKEHRIGKFFKYFELLFFDFPKIFFHSFTSKIIHIQWFSKTPILFFEFHFYKFLQKTFHKKLVFTAHNIFPHERNSQNFFHLKKIYSAFDKIIVMSNYSQKKLIDEFKIENSKIEIIPHGPLFYDFPTIEIEVARQKIGIEKNKFVVLFQGFFRKYKGVEFLLNTFSIFVKKYPNAILLLIGSGKDGYIFEIQNMIDYLKIPRENILQEFSFVSLEKISLYYNASNVCVLPYQHIYQSGVLATAMSFKKPIVVTSVGNFSEIIENNVNGKLIEYGNINQFQNALEEIYLNQNIQMELGKNAYKTITENYSWNLIAEKTKHIYEKLYNE